MKFLSAEFFKSLKASPFGKSIDCFKKNSSVEICVILYATPTKLICVRECK